MTHQSASSYVPGAGDPGEQVAQLHHVLELVEQIAGLPQTGSKDRALDEAARISSLYAAARPITQRRFDMLAEEIATWAATGVEALLFLQDRQRAPEPAAARLADALIKGLGRLVAILPENSSIKGRS